MREVSNELEIRELTDAELDMVAGGHGITLNTGNVFVLSTLVGNEIIGVGKLTVNAVASSISFSN
jgi:hypothetical protein